MSNDPTPEDIEALVARIDDDTPWDVEDWEHSNGRYEDATVTVEAVWDPLSELGVGESRSLLKETRAVIEDNQDGEGAHVDHVVDTVAESQGVGVDIAHEVIDELKQKGEIYEPQRDHLRSV